MMPSQDSKGQRLQVVLARFGIASRRGVVSLIEEGKVLVNGAVVGEKGLRVDPSKDKITVEGQTLALETVQRKRYFIFNKPKGVMTTLQDPHAESTVADFFKEIPERLFPVGRLDRDTTGLLILTNDGELAFQLTHPKFGVKKRYRARVLGGVPEEKVKLLERGIELEEGRTAPCKIDVKIRTSKDTRLDVTLHEGKKRQIRRIFEKVGHKVLELERVSYGPLSLGDLALGAKRELSAEEIGRLKAAAGLGGLPSPSPAVPAARRGGPGGASSGRKIPPRQNRPR
jgi:23S rRNA pseudouridine2605 synthase